MILFLYGPDAFRSRQKLNQICAKFRLTDPAKINLLIFDGSAALWLTMRQALITPPFLHTKKLVVIERLFQRKGLEKIEEEIQQTLSKELPSSTFAVFWEEIEPDKHSPLFLYFSKKGTSENFLLLKGQALQRWLNDFCKKEGYQIKKEALNLLITLIGEDTWQLTQELQKLFAYCAQDKIIAPEAVRLLVQGKFDENIFTFLDCLSQKRIAQASFLLENHLRQGAPAQYLLRMITWHCRILMQLREFYQQPGQNQVSLSEAGRCLKISPFVIKKALGFALRSPLSFYQRLFRLLLQLDLLSKKQHNPNLLLQLFIWKMA